MTNNSINTVISSYRSKSDTLLKQLLTFLSIPSISTASEHQAHMLKAANFLVEKFKQIGFENVEALPTPGHPIIYGEYLKSPGKPTILLYGHYDVQPPDPIEAWETPPFSPQIREDYVYARGASDMKGQIWAFTSALEAIMESTNLPLNIKLMIEGEEEIGSPSLEAFLERNKTLLKSDFVLNTDAGMLAPNKPTIVYGLRGMAYFELRIYGPNTDLHSGVFGGAVANPANILSKIISGMHDENHHVTLPGFYDRVRELTENERKGLSELGMDSDFFKSITGVSELYGEKGFSPVEQVSARPTLDVNGLYAGYIKKGAKTIIPAYAMAKISTRLVPNQDPNEIHQSMKSYLELNVPEAVRWEIDFLSGAPAYLAETHTPGLSKFIDALKSTWGVQPLMKREGGSIPVATAMKEILGIDLIITGFGLPDDKIHSPNERMHLPTHRMGVEALIRFFLSF